MKKVFLILVLMLSNRVYAGVECEISNEATGKKNTPVALTQRQDSPYSYDGIAEGRTIYVYADDQGIRNVAMIKGKISKYTSQAVSLENEAVSKIALTSREKTTTLDLVCKTN